MQELLFEKRGRPASGVVPAPVAIYGFRFDLSTLTNTPNLHKAVIEGDEHSNDLPAIPDSLPSPIIAINCRRTPVASCGGFTGFFFLMETLSEKYANARLNIYIDLEQYLWKHSAFRRLMEAKSFL